MQFPGNVFNHLGTASLADIEGKALGVKWIIRKKLKLLLFHLVATKTINALNLKFDVHAPVTTGNITILPILAVIESSVNPVACAADCFFPCSLKQKDRIHNETGQNASSWMNGSGQLMVMVGLEGGNVRCPKIQPMSGRLLKMLPKD